jgi:ABC-2 type transport system permease protein
MATRAIKPRRDDTILTGWQSMPETAPSVMRQDQPTVARFLAMFGVMLTAVGLLALLTPAFEWRYPVAPGWGAFFLSIGLVLILYHAFVDKDVQFRRVYMAFALLLAGFGVLSRVLPLGGGVGGIFLPYGIYSLGLALLFSLAVLHNEDEAPLRNMLLFVLGVLGAIMILAGLLVGQFNADFLAGEGVLLLLLGLMFAGGFIGMQGMGSDAGHHAGVALGVAGAVTVGIVILRALWPVLFPSEETSDTFFIPSGLSLLVIGLGYVGVALAICTDWPLVVLMRREMAAYFYSPLAYLVLVAVVLVAWINFRFFVSILESSANPRAGMLFEPIVRYYIISLIPVIAQMFVVPVLTMRLLSEEKRSGTLEMLLTVPVNEITVTLSKFLAAWLFYLLTWAPALLFLVGLRSMGGDEFDYRPLLSFMFTVAATGAGFIAMGLFFSCITRNQIIAAVFTFVGMTLHLAFYLMVHSDQTNLGAWADILEYASFIDLWIRSLEGVLAPRYLVFHLSVAVFFLYLTNKVLEARKWS